MKVCNFLLVLTWPHNQQASPRIRFNKEGTLLAVSTLDNGFKILANADGLRLLRTLENRSFDASHNASETLTKVLPYNCKSCETIFANMIQ
jgi:hypothetical protein